VNWPKGELTKVVERGSEPKSQVSLTFHGKAKWDRANRDDLQILGNVLQIRLREVLREDLGGVYGVGAGGGISHWPRTEYVFSVRFGCSPDNVEVLRKKVLEEIAKLQKAGIGADYLDKVRQTYVRGHETDLKDNGFWEDQLEDAYRHGEDPALIVDQAPLLGRISSDNVRAAAQRFLKNDSSVLGVLKPESGK